MEDFEACGALMDSGVLPLRCPVDAEGRFTDQVGLPDLEGLTVLEEGNEAVLRLLEASGGLLHSYSHPHRYPYDWRTKKAVILRATPQWFVSLEPGRGRGTGRGGGGAGANCRDLKGESLSALREVSFVPPTGESRLSAMIASRSEWCISRQRVWGVPLPVFYKAGDEGSEPLVDPVVIRHVKDLVALHGTDVWWQWSSDDLLPEGYKGLGWEQGKDTLDIWLDSGVSWLAALEPRGIVAPVDLYLEGSDQHRGWFQSSLLTSIALTKARTPSLPPYKEIITHDPNPNPDPDPNPNPTKAPPYKEIITHGFVLDGKGKKMSKSVGNVVDPSLIVDGGKNASKHPPYGADLLRW